MSNSSISSYIYNPLRNNLNDNYLGNHANVYIGNRSGESVQFSRIISLDEVNQYTEYFLIAEKNSDTYSSIYDNASDFFPIDNLDILELMNGNSNATEVILYRDYTLTLYRNIPENVKLVKKFIEKSNATVSIYNRNNKLISYSIITSHFILALILLLLIKFSISLYIKSNENIKEQYKKVFQDLVLNDVKNVKYKIEYIKSTTCTTKYLFWRNVGEICETEIKPTYLAEEIVERKLFEVWKEYKVWYDVRNGDKILISQEIIETIVKEIPFHSLSDIYNFKSNENIKVQLKVVFQDVVLKDVKSVKYKFEYIKSTTCTTKYLFWRNVSKICYTEIKPTYVPEEIVEQKLFEVWLVYELSLRNGEILIRRKPIASLSYIFNIFEVYVSKYK